MLPQRRTGPVRHLRRRRSAQARRRTRRSPYGQGQDQVCERVPCRQGPTEEGTSLRSCGCQETPRRGSQSGPSDRDRQPCPTPFAIAIVSRPDTCAAARMSPVRVGVTLHHAELASRHLERTRSTSRPFICDPSGEPCYDWSGFGALCTRGRACQYPRQPVGLAAPERRLPCHPRPHRTARAAADDTVPLIPIASSSRFECW